MSENNAGPKLLLKGTRVRYMGCEAVVVRGNEPDEWSEGVHPLVAIAFTGKKPWGWSKTQEVFASACTVI